ncbi:conserved protein of unknown function [Georgfuchsia toluolica]|uniref:UPF0102 protein GTOL_11985 n=2 Tax=Georgfuchsia toluolica TaxID=424218 RepID=A0A916J532_9PROT|nr:YraN family protein [Georgfuchsia toluolica]CAG4884102.1 conserved protein of unknown function [Georgfuchsia toluolica]
MDRIVRPAALLRKRAAASGQAAEDVAAGFLAHRGLKVVERNFRVRGGEIDLICTDGRTLVFVEVRLRGSDKFGGAAASITPRKQQRIVLAARHWLSRHGNAFVDRDCRFDCVVMDAPDEARIEWIENAFLAD